MKNLEGPPSTDEKRQKLSVIKPPPGDDLWNYLMYIPCILIKNFLLDIIVLEISSKLLIDMASYPRRTESSFLLYIFSFPSSMHFMYLFLQKFPSVKIDTLALALC